MIQPRLGESHPKHGIDGVEAVVLKRALTDRVGEKHSSLNRETWTCP